MLIDPTNYAQARAARRHQHMPISERRGKVLITLMAILTLTGCGSAPPDGPGREVEIAQSALRPGWFGGYLDVTLFPGLPPQKLSSQGTVTTVISFISSHPTRPCEPAWGGFYDLDRASDKLDLDAKVDAFRAGGNDIAVSFGGQRGTDLAAACTDADALVRAYTSVISRYGVDTVDLDIEGTGASDHAAVKRRAAAIMRLQAERPPDDPLRVWLTLPVSREGLTPAAVISVETMLESGVDLAGVNIMTMNFGPLAPGETMLDAAVAAAEATHRTLAGMYATAGKPVGAAALWNRIGLTPMIGVNDIAGNVFTLKDAEGLNSFALERGIGRMSMWSLNRDTACNAAGQGQTSSSAASDCSGVDQEPGAFAKVLANAFTHPP
jgi:chitinase